MNSRDEGVLPAALSPARRPALVKHLEAWRALACAARRAQRCSGARTGQALPGAAALQNGLTITSSAAADALMKSKSPSTPTGPGALNAVPLGLTFRRFRSRPCIA